MLAKHGRLERADHRPDPRRGWSAAAVGLGLGPGAAAHPRAHPAHAHAVHDGPAGGSGQPGPRLHRRASTASTACHPRRSSGCSSSTRSIRRTQYLYVLAVLFVCFAFVRTLVYSPFGQSLTGIRENTLRMHAVGAPVRARLVICYTLSAAHRRGRGRHLGAGQRLRQPGHARPGPRGHRAHHPRPRRPRAPLRRLHRAPSPTWRSPTFSSKVYPTAWQLGLGLLLVVIALVREERHCSASGGGGLARAPAAAGGAVSPPRPPRHRMTGPLLETRGLCRTSARSPPRATSTSGWRPARATR